MKPILFNTEMVRAILDGRKTVTRRVVKPHFRTGETSWQLITEKHSGKYVRIEYLDEWENETRYMSEPFRPGDILYVQETWARSMAGTYIYKATDTPIIIDRWRPSIHMPKEAARLFLRVTDVRVERLRDITEDGAVKEGCSAHGGNMALDEFEEVWASTTSNSYGWDANPWVWVIEFERISKETALSLEGGEG